MCESEISVMTESKLFLMDYYVFLFHSLGASREDDGSATGGRSNLESIAIVAVEGKKSISDLKKFLIQNFDLI